MNRSRGAEHVLTALALALLALALLAGACSSGGTTVSSGSTNPPVTPSTTVTVSPTIQPSPPLTPAPCHGAASASVGLAWLPASLPLPPGSYSVFDSSTDDAHHRALIDSTISATATVRFITTIWAQQGWTVRPAPLADQPQRYSYTRAHSTLSGLVSVVPLTCDQSWSQVTLSLTSH